MLRNPTSPLPDDEIIKNSPALLTLQEFLDRRNPYKKYHESDILDYSMSDINYPADREIGLIYGSKTYGQKYIVSEKSKYNITVIRKTAKYPEDESSIVGIVYNKTFYYSNPYIFNRIKNGYWSNTFEGPFVKFDYNKSKRIKYLNRKYEKIAVLDANFKKYKNIIQQIIVNNKKFSIRSEGPLGLNNGKSIVILDNKGRKVALIQSEWGATLLVVAREHRGKGFGKLLARIWYYKNPDFTSGGFTKEGEKNAIKTWNSEVQRFLSQGWYQILIDKNRITKKYLKKILSDYESPKKIKKDNSKEELDILVYSDDTVLAIYDSKFYENFDQKYIYAYGFLRERNGRIFLYRLDYEEPYEKLAILVSLQIARDNDECLYFDEYQYTDFVDFEKYGFTINDNQEYCLNEDILDLKHLAYIEKSRRMKAEVELDHIDILNYIMEQGEGKWS